MKILVARSPEEIEQAYEKLSRAENIGCDTETSGLSPQQARLLSVQFSDGEFNVLVPASEGVGLGRLRELLTDPAKRVIFHNARFDLAFLRANGYPTRNVFCTMIAEKLLTKGADQSASLADTLYRYFAVDLEKSHRTKFTRNWNGIWTKDLVDYALADVFYLPKLMQEQSLAMERLGMTEDFRGQMDKLLNQHAL
ncbi:MAG: hypothetical protein R2747_12350 [Pyrinomonadaceae bacterium]